MNGHRNSNSRRNYFKMIFVTFLGLVCLNLVTGEACSPIEFLCPISGVCIPQRLVCDGYADCLGGSDEVNCPSTTTTLCPGWVCPISGECIPQWAICNGYYDCPDQSDEQFCNLTTTTPCSGFFCNDGRCIPGDWQCDGFLDCDDGEDEAGCPCNGFECNDNRCIPSSWVCDGANDCGEWEDENEEACPCSDNELRCPRAPGSELPGHCIPLEFICDEDSIWDCWDGSDEANCTKSGIIQRSRSRESSRFDFINGNSAKQLLKIAYLKDRELKAEERRQLRIQSKTFQEQTNG